MSNSFAIDFHSWLLEESCRKHYLLKYTINIWLQDLQNEEICDNLQNTTTRSYEFVQPIRKKRNFKKSFRDEREDEAFKFMKKAVDEISARDEFCTFGNFVADIVRKLKPINQILAKRQITNMLMNLQIKEMEICERQCLPSELPETSVETYNSDTQSFIFDESTNLAVNKVDYLTSHDNMKANVSFEISEYLSFNADNEDI